MWWLWGLPASHLPPAAPACDVRGWVTLHRLKFWEFAEPGPWAEAIRAGPTTLPTKTRAPGQRAPALDKDAVHPWVPLVSLHPASVPEPPRGPSPPAQHDARAARDGRLPLGAA